MTTILHPDQTVPLTGRAVRCRYLADRLNRCTSEAVDDSGEIILCYRHLGRALELIQRKLKEAATS